MTQASIANAPVVSVAPKRRWRLQYSLRTLVLLTITAGALLLFGMSYRETVALREETKRLRDELGVLNITDPSKVHIIAGRTTGECEAWRWHVFCPEGRDLHLGYKFSEHSPSRGSGEEYEGNGTLLRGCGQIALLVYIFKSPSRQWQLGFHCVHSEGRWDDSADVPPYLEKWLDAPLGGYLRISQAGENGTESEAPGKPLELLDVSWHEHLNVSSGGLGVPQGPEVCNLRIWIEEAKPEKWTKP